MIEQPCKRRYNIRKTLLEDSEMRKTASLLLAVFLLLSLLPACFAESSSQMPDPSEHYLIPADVNTFDALYRIMCNNLNLREHPLPEPDQGEWH